jgi:threonyl-tRNA synthetase
MPSDVKPSLAELRHTAAHVLAYAVMDLFPDAKPTIGPSIESGFYYDFDRVAGFTPEDLARLEARMHEIVAANYPMTGREVTRDEAIGYFKDNPYKVELARDIPEGQPITLYTIGEFTDLCRGGHADSTGEIGALKLTGLAGAYWRGNEANPMLQRIYGTAWYDRDELDAYLRQVEEALKRDHRKLGVELDLYSIEDDAGTGLVFWHPKGAIVRGLIEDFIREGLRERDYQPVVTPHVVSEKLYEISGHLENYAANMFGPLEVEEQRFRLKPMNCPGHILIYRSRLHSYRDLPIRYSEFGTVYRYERSGVVHGLTRVRGFTQDDAHLFCTPEQLQGEFERTLDEAMRLMKAFEFRDVEYVLSLERFFGILVEHYGGAFPAWLAPVQVAILPIAERHLGYARECGAALRASGFRVEVDESNEKLGYKIRHWKTLKIPYVLVVGDQEAQDGTVNVNERGVEAKRTLSIVAFSHELRVVVESKKGTA